ncbi:alpha/beta fold hydrolase [Lacisediminimonas profundi]|uniref:alpha/beta fold hydrolase n=1 Tax=Lacisediminimonas profundi TaxID=2603856 RepID=UPI00240CECC3|nr:alpha/beta hydrolase [Lacisediminimonas profundi]
MSFLYGKHVRANGIRQHYLRYGGTGPVVLLVPGIVSPAALWDHVGQWLGLTHDCYILDVRGRGLSESGPHLDYGVDACANDILAFAEALALGPHVVLGHSMGARIALHAARIDASSISQLILLDPPTSGPGRRLYPIPMERTLKLLRAAQRGEGELALRAADQAPWPEELLLKRAEWLPTCDERVVHVTYDDFHQQDMHADLQAVQVPVALICAGKGGVVSEDDVREMQGLNPRLRVTRLAAAGHQLQVDDFEGLCASLAHALHKPAS